MKSSETFLEIIDFVTNTLTMPNLTEREMDAESVREIEAKVREANYFSQHWGNRYLEHVRREPYDRVHAIALIQRCHWWAKRICTLAAVDKKG